MSGFSTWLTAHRHRRQALWIASLQILAGAPIATAAAMDAPPPSPEVAPNPQGQSPLLEGQKRATPSYGELEPPPPTARDVFIWIPRAILVPPHLAVEYLFRRPVVAFVRWGDEHYVFKHIYDAFTWDGGQSGIYPVAGIDLGIKSTVGLALVDRRFLAEPNALRASVSASTQGVFGVSAQDRLRVFRDGTGVLQLGAHFTERPDGVFYGVGPDTRSQDKTFYSYVSRAVALALIGDLGGLHHAIVEIGYRDTTFGSSEISPDTPSLDSRYGGVDQPPLPGGWNGFDLAWTRAALVLDSRNPTFESPATGARIEAGASYDRSLRDRNLALVSWGINTGVFYDVSGAHHILALEVAAQFIENIGAREIPFTELPELGGNIWMRGFLTGRLRGPSTIVASLQYRYPVSSFIEGELFSSLGNAFAGHLDGFELQRLFLNWGLGLRTTFSRDASIALTVAVASNRLDSTSFDPVDSTRLSLGVIHGF